VKAQLHTFLTSALDGGEGSSSCPGHITLKKDPSTHWMEGWMDPRAERHISKENGVKLSNTHMLSSRESFLLSVIKFQRKLHIICEYSKLYPWNNQSSLVTSGSLNNFL
jgi:hypothetical protein